MTKLFSAFFFLFPLAFALPFQEPVPGTYQCFVAGQDPFNANAQDAGAQLTFNPDSSYVLTTTSASEKGIVQAQENTIAELDALFQSGSAIGLQSSSGTANYGGLFVIDKQGSLYAFVQQSSGAWIRCESQDADLATAVQLARESQASLRLRSPGQKAASASPASRR